MTTLYRTPGWLRVRVGRAVGGLDAPVETRSVFCPFQVRSVALAECASCEFTDGLCKDADGKSTMVLCSRSLQETPEVDLGNDRRRRAAALLPVALALREETICVRPDMSVESLAQLFLDRGIGGAAVVDESGHAIGVVSKTDILAEWADEREDREVEPAPRELGPGFQVQCLARSTVAEIMSPVTITLPESAPIARAAALMAYEGIHRIPVTAPDGTVAGIVSSLDLLRWMARDDGYQIPDRNQRQR